MPSHLRRTRERRDPMQRHTRLRCALRGQHKVRKPTPITNKAEKTHNVDVVACTCDREVLTIVREAQVRDSLSGVAPSVSGSKPQITNYALADRDGAGGDPLAGIEQIHDRVEPARGEVAPAGVERGCDAAADMRCEVLAQCEGGYVDDANRVL
jgi:hypothetical protein